MIEIYQRGAAKLTRRLDHYIPGGAKREDLTMNYMIYRGAFFCGDPDTVYNQIKELYDEIGGFGVLLLIAGKDWATGNNGSARCGSSCPMSPRGWLI